MNKLKISLIYGLIAGLVMTSSWWLFNLLFSSGEEFDFNQGEIIGYAAMLLALTAVFIGVKNYRDKQLSGIINFKNAFLTGLYIVLVASVIYVVGWMIYYPNFMPDFMDKYAAAQISEMETSGMPAAEIDARKTEMKEWMELYENPVIMAGMTFMEVFPIGLVVALIAAWILKRKPRESLNNGSTEGF